MKQLTGFINFKLMMLSFKWKLQKKANWDLFNNRKILGFPSRHQIINVRNFFIVLFLFYFMHATPEIFVLQIVLPLNKQQKGIVKEKNLNFCPSSPWVYNYSYLSMAAHAVAVYKKLLQYQYYYYLFNISNLNPDCRRIFSGFYIH